MDKELIEFLSKCNTPDDNKELFTNDTLVFNNPNAFQLMSGNKWNCGTDTGYRYCDTNCYGEWARLWFYSRDYEGEFFDKIVLENEESDLLTGKKYIIMIDPLNSALGWERMRQVDKENAEVAELDEKTKVTS